MTRCLATNMLSFPKINVEPFNSFGGRMATTPLKVLAFWLSCNEIWEFLSTEKLRCCAFKWFFPENANWPVNFIIWQSSSSFWTSSIKMRDFKRRGWQAPRCCWFKVYFWKAKHICCEATQLLPKKHSYPIHPIRNGRKRGDVSRRIVTARRVVTTRHESSPTVSTAKRDSGSVHLPLKKLADHDDPRRVAKLARTATQNSGWRVYFM